MSPFSRASKFSYARLKLLSRPVIALPIVTFAVFIAISAATYVVSQSSVNSARERTIDRRAQENSLKLSTSIASYTLIASGGAGFAESAEVTADSWASFVSTYDITDNFPAINAVTYAKVLSPEDAQAFVEDRNQQTGSDLSLAQPLSQDDPFILVTYVNPNSPAFATRVGTNEYAIDTRKSTIDTAVQNGAPALTTSPQYIQPAEGSNQPARLGFIIFAPIYDKSLPLGTADQRKAALRGTANVSFQTAKFFDTIYADSERQTRTYLTVYQGPDESSPKVYSGGVRPAAGDRVDHVEHTVYEGQTFTYHYQFSDSDLLTLAERSRPFVLLLTGLVLGAMLSVTLLFLTRARLHKASLDKEHEIQNAKDELLSLASHQLRTPATGVKQYMGMVLQGFAGEITDQQKDFLQKAYDSNDRQLHIINDILHLAKLDAGRIVLTKTSFDMSELVSSVLEEQADSAAEGEITLINKLPKKLDVYADSHMMRMVVENLLSNAIKYTHPGGKVSVSLKPSKTDYELSVIDSGVGIADDDLDKLFKQFSRVANERSHLVSGTGVGLYLVKNLVELHGGEVTVSSKAGKGTTFKLSFPHESK